MLTSALQFNTEEDEMRQVDRVYRRDSAFAQEAAIIVLTCFVVYAELDIKRK